VSPGNTPTAGNPVLEDPKNKHLAKAKPPALDNRAAAASAAPNVGSTDPSLRTYQDRRSSGGGAFKVLLVVVILVVVLVALVLFVKPVRDAVRPLFPSGIQRLLMDDETKPMASETPAAPSTMAPKVATPVSTAPSTKAAVSEAVPLPATPVTDAPTVPPPTQVPAEAPATVEPKAAPNGQ
jgi:hypothetical protein